LRSAIKQRDRQSGALVAGFQRHTIYRGSILKLTIFL
jgi:hypothetical protein